MRPGSVIVDLAAETGGNVEVTKAGETVEHNGVIILGQLNLPSTMPVHASQMFAKNIQNLLDLLIKNGALEPDYEDEIVKGTVITRGGDIVHEMTRQRLAEVGDAAPVQSAQNLVSTPSSMDSASANGGDASSEATSGLDEPAVPAGAIVGDGSADCPADYPIKGNASSAIFHEPDSASYGRTIPEFCFNSVEAAEAAGFRASRA
jgi:hypothetical protein